MKTYIALAAALALASCGSGDEAVGSADGQGETPAAAAPDSPLIGTYGSTDMDGNSWTSAMNADGTYQDTMNGEVTETGTWTHLDDQVCFTPAPIDGATADATCLTLINVNDDGSLLMSDGTGAETTVPRIEG
jgi:hypothetical protein